MEIRFLQKFSALFKEIWFLWTLCLIFNIITFFLIKYKVRPNGQTLALHYNVLVGVDWYGPGNNLYFIPAVGLIISLANFLLYYLLRDDKNFLSFLAPFVSLSVQLILLFAALFLAGVN